MGLVSLRHHLPRTVVRVAVCAVSTAGRPVTIAVCVGGVVRFGIVDVGARETGIQVCDFKIHGPLP